MSLTCRVWGWHFLVIKTFWGLVFAFLIPRTISSTEWVNMCYLQKLCRVLVCTVKVMLGTAFCGKQAFCRE